MEAETWCGLFLEAATERELCDVLGAHEADCTECAEDDTTVWFSRPVVDVIESL